MAESQNLAVHYARKTFSYVPLLITPCAGSKSTGKSSGLITVDGVANDEIMKMAKIFYHRSSTKAESEQKEIYTEH